MAILFYVEYDEQVDSHLLYIIIRNIILLFFQNMQTGTNKLPHFYFSEPSWQCYFRPQRNLFKICKLVRTNYANYHIFPRRNHHDNFISVTTEFFQNMQISMNKLCKLPHFSSSEPS